MGRGGEQRGGEGRILFFPMNWNSSHFKNVQVSWIFVNLIQWFMLAFPDVLMPWGIKESCYEVVINLLTKPISIIYGFGTLNFTNRNICHCFFLIIEDSSSQQWTIHFLKEQHGKLRQTARPPTTTVPPLLLPTPCPSTVDALPSATADPSWCHTNTRSMMLLMPYFNT